MENNKPLVNRVAASGLITINLEDFFPTKEVVVFDIKDYLYMELMLKEKDFRTALKAHDWEQYSDKHLLVYCSTDAIVPVWAFMLVTAYATPHALSVFNGEAASFYQQFFNTALAEFNAEQYDGQRIVIKGCSNRQCLCGPDPLTTALRAKHHVR